MAPVGGKEETGGEGEGKADERKSQKGRRKLRGRRGAKKKNYRRVERKGGEEKGKKEVER